MLIVKGLLKNKNYKLNQPVSFLETGWFSLIYFNLLMSFLIFYSTASFSYSKLKYHPTKAG
ncbi:MAG: hypothetical protein A3I88_01710 [Candidatus Portnoybacteria bacterium RIFCSPLOWO2_12_FULL_39_9]|uniref:Uncharacterized protein n=1 Tax=Candidatus Portnoybacteria bacterium RIFCSPHIGHO2_12_FULL_38_9 TaxID=1801997 RepID=A0A1G2FGY8_9BACT|nr:MAG: hypothetical protein A2646_01680 [Candidatus Portnoybacteria bacterium RIFCSPHIGHO2_02_FULL_39_12]OGZ37333.1 MAG: hypothetical protein A3J64_01990 [Candidatus Portnoybacteria bacterium RIFCSPHIGHO2_12_FULL_38_9]OGZ38322.1 MAG: hypothetical protein A3F21_02965 [Candidatus Portnoybacteria bacterium RIFCSPLOWO2_01_FULL_38_39]OGZ39922.1 MAG: hypothetical protein A3I88_01710 [Candidatus Portnoybacteria bacterium RIFCSPLOWO2_12_FULL_39_9]